MGIENFRSLPEGDWEGNFGGYGSVNFANKLPISCCSDYGFHMGGSFGAYDWNGRLSAPSIDQTKTQLQAFLTVGFFRYISCESGLNANLAFDWMWNRNLGVFALNPNLGQLRFKVGYLFSEKNEFGLWGTGGIISSKKISQEIPVKFCAINQINAFFRQIYCNQAETTFWIGIPYSKSLMYSSGFSGKFIVGASFKVPVSSHFFY